MIRICYIDESGCTGMLPSATSQIQPILVIAGIVFHQNHLTNLTQEYLTLKRKYFPALTPATVPFLEHVKAEIKGSDIRTTIRNGNRNQRRHALGFLDGYVSILERYNAKIFGRIWIKGIGRKINGAAIYTSSIQAACGDFQNLLEFENLNGIIIADSRDYLQNIGVSYSIFTQKFKATGDAYGRILEMPTFGHSQNHIGIQLSDILCSAILFPMASFTYCTGYINSVHVSPKYDLIKKRYADRIKALRHRYLDGGRYRGGITVSDDLAKRSVAPLFVV